MLCIYSTNLSNISCIIFQKSWWKYIFFQSLYQTREDILYVIHISSCISRATICAKISKILKISNFSQLHLISKLIPQSSLIYFPPTVSHKSSRYISRATSPVLSFFFFFFFISKSTTAIHQRDLRLAHICSRIFLLQTRVIFQN